MFTWSSLTSIQNKILKFTKTSRRSFNASTTKKGFWKDFLSQTGTAKFQKTRSSREAAHAFLPPYRTWLGDARDNKAAFHGYWGFSGLILKGAGVNFRTRTPRGYERWSGRRIFKRNEPTLPSGARTQLWVHWGCCSPYDAFTVLSFREPRKRIKDNLSSTVTRSTGPATWKQVAIFTPQTKMSHLLCPASKKNECFRQIDDSRFSLRVLAGTIWTFWSPGKPWAFLSFCDIYFS